MKNRFIKKLKKFEGLPLTVYFLEKGQLTANNRLMKIEKMKSLHSDASSLIKYYKPISKF